MAHATPRSHAARLHESPSETVTTTIFVCNLHCPSCVGSIQESLSCLQPPPESVSYSIDSHSVVIRHQASLTAEVIAETLEVAGFELHSIFQNHPSSVDPVEVRTYDSEWHNSLEQAVSRWRKSWKADSSSTADMRKVQNMEKMQKHVQNCEQCRAEGGIHLTDNGHQSLPLKPEPALVVSEKTPPADSFVVVDTPSSPNWCEATLSISGMTCSSCVSSITHAAEQLPWVKSIDVNLLSASGTVVFEGKHRVEEVVEAIEDCGFDAAVEKVEELQPAPKAVDAPQRSDRWRATFAIGGMTCSSCVGNITNALRPHSWIEKADVNLVSNSASIVFLGKGHEAEIKEIIEDTGYDATLDEITSEDSTQKETVQRSIAIRIDGMFCRHCPGRITHALEEQYAKEFVFQIEEPELSEKKPILSIRYIPIPTRFTIRHILETIEDLNPAFKPSIYHPPTIEDRAREMHARERKRVLFRLALSVLVAIPTFILGIVYMSLVSSHNPVRRYLMRPMWAGNATRLGWALFILATPVYFFAADTFHIRTMKEIRAMWRPGSRMPLLHRFYRFGSMNMLLSLGTTIAYVASVVELALAAVKLSSGAMSDEYFDSVVFLTMFILFGRFLEAYSKSKAGDAVTALGKLRPDTAILVENSKDQKIATDLLEIGDVVKVPHGASPPFDGMIVDAITDFDESSLTGESRPVRKASGDMVYSGTINKGSPVQIRLTAVSGTSMLDHIINAVREGQTRRAPVERVADIITSHFVPFVTAVAIITWVIWLSLGSSGVLPSNWRDETSGGWAFWSLRFAIAVFVVACPCGIGLAAPTALFVGGGLAAKHGILVKGGGEAFQEASSLDCIVFDKTGTLTQGGDPAVTEHLTTQDEELVLSIVKSLESNSSHPIAHALTTFCSNKTTKSLDITAIGETPGKGMRGACEMESSIITVIVGNEALLSDNQVSIPASVSTTLSDWKSQGKSIALAATLTTPKSGKAEEATWAFAAAFAISDPIRPDAASTIAALKKRNIDVWMLSGDNETTAQAVGAQVGIPCTNIIAGVLPDQKAEKIKYLQRSLTKRSSKSKNPVRATIAMVGDGINDAPALSTADLSIAMSSGSDIALSSSNFILLSPNLGTLLTLLDLSRIVFRRVWFNFGWALVYNVIAMPIAAGVLFPVQTGARDMGDGMKVGGRHVKLDPVWASLAMALSSVSVVCSSLALRSGIPGIGFRVRKENR